MALKERHKRIHDIGNGKPHDEGGNQSVEIMEEGCNAGADGRQIADDFFEKDQQNCNTQYIQTDFSKQFIVLEAFSALLYINSSKKEASSTYIHL